MKKRVVGLTYDLRTDYIFKEGDPKDANAEFDSEAVINIVAESLAEGGNEVVKIGSANNLLKQIDKLSVDIVFNIAEGIGKRNRESQIPVILEMYNIPYVGSDGFTLALTLDKIMAKRIMIQSGIPTPNFIEINNSLNLNGLADHLRFPLIVKPRHEGTSKGITEEARVENKEKLKKRAEFIINSYKQPALVEEFIRGKEFTVGLIGNDEDIKVLPPVQIEIDGQLHLGDKFYSFARVSSDKLKYICPAKVSNELNEKLKNIALKTYQAVECKDFGRIDFRVNDNDEPFVLEINPLPSLSVEDIFMVVTKELKIGFTDVVNMILEVSLKRHGIK